MNSLYRWIMVSLSFIVSLSLFTCTQAEAGPNPQALIKTSMGDIKLELNSDKAPISVENFLVYKERFL